MAESVPLLCLMASLISAALLARSYLKWRTSLLFWSALGFGLLALNSLLVAIDLALPNVDLTILRGFTNLIGLGCLFCGFWWKTERA